MRTCMPKCKQRLLTALGQKYEKDIQTSPAQRAYATSEYNSDTSRVTLQFVMVLCRSCHSQGHSLCVLCVVHAYTRGQSPSPRRVILSITSILAFL